MHLRIIGEEDLLHYLISRIEVTIFDREEGEATDGLPVPVGHKEKNPVTGFLPGLERLAEFIG